MDVQITEAQIIDKLEKKLGQKEKAIATLEVVIEELKNKLTIYEDESTLELK